MIRIRRPLLTLLVTMAATLALLLVACGGGSDEKEPVIFSDLNWPSAEIQARVASYIVQHGYEYPVELVPGDTVSLWQALSTTTRT